jgi:phosphatidylglycerophosphate synthase
MKLILNAVDGIIARERNESTRLGMALNVGTDIGPDMYIIWMILLVYSTPLNSIYLILGIIGIYLLGELLFIGLFRKQNLFFGKDLRTFFYIFLALVLYFGLDSLYLVYFYFIITTIHVAGFFLPKYRT